MSDRYFYNRVRSFQDPNLFQVLNQTMTSQKTGTWYLLLCMNWPTRWIFSKFYHVCHISRYRTCWIVFWLFLYVFMVKRIELYKFINSNQSCWIFCQEIYQRTVWTLFLKNRLITLKWLRNFPGKEIPAKMEFVNVDLLLFFLWKLTHYVSLNLMRYIGKY